MASNDREILDLLIEREVISSERAATAVTEAESRGVPLLKYLTHENIVPNASIIAAASHLAGLEFIDLARGEADRFVASRLTSDQANRWDAIPVREESGGRVVIAVPFSKAQSLQLKDDLRAATGARQVVLAVAMKDEIHRAIANAYRAEGELHQIGQASAEEEERQQAEDSLDDFTEITEESKIVRYVELAIMQAIADGASDIHFEQDERVLRIRYRIDGVLHDISTAPRGIANEITSRIKILSELDIAERRKPQDGRLSVNYRGQQIDLRVSVLPTVWGEKIVMRILDNSQASFELAQLGFSKNNLARFEAAYKKPYGMILVTGPTGSGKSTTLYAALNQISNPEVNIITVEDPVEYRVPRINQVPVNPKAGLTFASALRSILRNDPDVILVGEIRDKETATIAIEAGLTGHLVLSTLHTNDASSAITRLTEMGVEPFLVSSVVEAIVAQRLVRRLCPSCKEPYSPTLEEVHGAGFKWDPDKPLPDVYRPVGCRDCANTGYRGRMAIHEVLLHNDTIEKLTVAGASATEIRNAAVEDGMTTLKEDGWLKVQEGQTAIAEVLRVVA